MSNRHPLETSSWLSKLNNFWTFKEMAKVSKAGTYTQQDHYELPEDDDPLLNKDLLYAEYKKTGGLMSSIWNLFWGKILGLIFLTTLFQALQQGGGYVLGLIVAQIYDGRISTTQERYELGFKCGYLVASNLIFPMIYNFVVFYSKRLSLRVCTAMSLIVFDKVTRCNIMNRSEHSAGNILNYVQIDCDKFFANIPKILDLYGTIMQLGFGIFVMYLQIKWLAFIVLGVAMAGILVLICFYYFRVIIMDDLMTAKDNRVATLSNAISNIKFVKMKGWENYFQYKVSVKRDIEMKSLFKIACFNGAELFTMWFSQGTCYFTTLLLLVYFSPELISISVVSACINVLFINFEAIIMFPLNAGGVMDFTVSLKRLSKFLKFEEISYEHVKNDPEILKDYAVCINNGNFNWNGIKSEEDCDLGEGPKNKDVHNESLGDNLLDNSVGGRDGTGFCLTNINFKARRGQLVFVIGKIGCGKTSLLYAMMGEMPKTDYETPTEVHREQKAAMLSQTPWLLGTTIKANILLDKPLDQELFDKALRLSQLADDIKEMPEGIETFIGENGQTVSGGQRTRIGLARCIYQDPELYILDDPLSALDLKVADRIMREAINGELKGKTVIIATHAIHNLKYADYIYVMEQGKIVFEGTFQEITQSSIYNEFKAVTDDYTTNEIEDPTMSPEPKKRKTSFMVKRKDSNFKEDFFTQVLGKNLDPTVRENDKLHTEVIELDNNIETDDPLLNRIFMEEDKEKGKIGLDTLKIVLKEIGGFFPLMMIMIACLTLVSLSVVIDLHTLEFSQFFDPLDKFEYLWFIGFCLLMRAVLTIIRSTFVFGTQLIMSKQLHARMLFRVLHSKIGDFLERVPTGRIINRFTKDIEVIDRDIGWAFSGLMIESTGTAVSVGILIWSIGPLLCAPVLFFFIFGVMLQRKMMNTKREIVRLESISRSPIMTCVTGLLKGGPEIRVLEKQSFVKEEYLRKLEDLQKNTLLITGLDQWYMTIVNTINIFLIQLPGFVVIYYVVLFSTGTFPLPKLVLFVLKSLEISYTLMYALMQMNLLESQFISIERCSKFSQIEPEPHYLNFAIHEKKYLHPNNRHTIVHIMKEMAKNEKAIITRGKVSLLKITAKYATKPNPVLNNLNLSVKPGEKIGIVGRTGAGKTSLIKLFWMCLEPSEGMLIIDGKDVSKIDLKVLRSNLDIISQETAIFEGTLRENLDPKLEYLGDKTSASYKKRDKELLDKLLQIGFEEHHLDGKGLDFMISANGDNLSLGQKQLLCFMRVLIDPKKLMILDEATANIDLKTEKLMQGAVQREFHDSTMFIIAHRIQTVLDCDKICLMEYGKIAEFGTPKELIRTPGSKFAEIYQKLKDNIGGDDDTGLV